MLSARQLRLEVPGRTLAEALDFDLRPGRCCALLGRNGTGKSSLLLTLAGLRPAQGGTVHFEDKPLAPPAQRARQIGVLLQEEPESFWGSTLDYVRLGRLPHGEMQADEHAAKALADMDLSAQAHQAYRSLSGGERQRARIAQLLAQDPQYFLLDEPLTHLDLGHQRLVMEHLAALAHAGRAVLMVLHEPAWTASYCEEVLLLYDADRFLRGPAQEILTVQNLEALYGCRLENSVAGNRMLFVPA